MQQMGLLEELTWRGMVHDMTEGLAEVIEPRTRHGVYRIRSHGGQPACGLATDR